VEKWLEKWIVRLPIAPMMVCINAFRFTDLDLWLRKGSAVSTFREAFIRQTG
jgi:hypothetical protein